MIYSHIRFAFDIYFSVDWGLRRPGLGPDGVAFPFLLIFPEGYKGFFRATTYGQFIGVNQRIWHFDLSRRTSLGEHMFSF